MIGNATATALISDAYAALCCCRQLTSLFIFYSIKFALCLIKKEEIDRYMSTHQEKMATGNFHANYFKDKQICIQMLFK